MHIYYKFLVLPLLFCSLVIFVGTLAAQTRQVENLEQVTNDEFVDLYPDVSPDGRYVAFMSRQKSETAGKNFDIFIKDIQNGNITRLDTDEADDAFPSWTIDGKSILFDSYRRVDKRAIWRKAIVGGTIAKITNIDKAAFQADPHPDGQKLVFNAWAEDKDVDIRQDGEYWKAWKRHMPEILTIDLNGSHLSSALAKGLNPKWSPDGSKIVFANNTYGNYEIYTIAADGSDLFRVTSREATDIEPAWSPDGRHIVFTSNQGNNWNLWMVNPDGTGLSELTTHEEFEGGPMWASDGFIYFHSNQNGNWDIWRLKPAGYKPVPLDIDGDGISNKNDKCPEEAEDFDGFQDQDGCPDLDNDGDGIPDVKDKCPNEPEDLDGFQDEDGCPDLDNDGDRIPDSLDKCPKEPEIYNFYKDEDGCPDEAPIKNKDLLAITFKPGKPKISEDNIPILETLVESLKQMPKARIAIKAYSEAKNSHDLTQQRADVIRAYLLKRGIEPGRVVALGMGDAELIASNKTSAGRQKNNRVAIEILNLAEAR